MVDGISAPIFWAVVASWFSFIFPLSPIECSAIGVLLYKAVNTMDSMIGYKNDMYLKFGRTAAKLDDVVNFIPARLSGGCLIIAAFLLKLDYRNAARIFLRDRNEHASPNAGHTEAAVAGALNIRLGGPQNYFNKRVDKPYMGDDERKPVAEDIKLTNTLIVVASGIFLLVAVVTRLILI
jgi:adenosylcobinamide-phosphate synthase